MAPLRELGFGEKNIGKGAHIIYDLMLRLVYKCYVYVYWFSYYIRVVILQ